MATSLLEKTRKINRLLQRSENLDYNSVSNVLSAVLNANVYITDKEGKFCGHALVNDFECSLMLDHVIKQGKFPAGYVNWLLKHDETSANLRSKSGRCVYDDKIECGFTKKNTTIVPIYGVGDRLGTLIVAKYEDQFDDDDILLAEYGATVVGMEMLRDRAQKNRIEERKKATVNVAIATLSYSEVDAAYHILKALDGNEGFLVASTIADEISITRSVIVNALRKLESAGLIDARSLGMKGTHIKVKNEYLFEEIKKIHPDNAKVTNTQTKPLPTTAKSKKA